MSAKVAIIFGGSRGIGGATASRLARDGFDVALTYVSRSDRATDLVSAIADVGLRAIAVRADSADPAAIRYARAEPPVLKSRAQHVGPSWRKTKSPSPVVGMMSLAVEGDECATSSPPPAEQERSVRGAPPAQTAWRPCDLAASSRAPCRHASKNPTSGRACQPLLRLPLWRTARQSGTGERSQPPPGGTMSFGQHTCGA